ncbi:MAG: hypothetical protein HOO88_07945 [Kiritimatiellaceae bacterium]|nr:hypothetical protein [Kiritimatiellaceae bacterium]
MKIKSCLAALFLILSVGWVYKVNFLDKPVNAYAPPALVGEVQASGRIEAQVITDGARAARFVWPGGTEFKPFEIPLSVGTEPLLSIRLDPLPDRTGTVRLKNVQFRSSSGKLTPIAASGWDSLNPRSVPQVEGDTLVISRLGAEDYPALLLKTPGPLDTAVDGFPRVTESGVWLLWVLCGVCVLGLLAVLLKVLWSARTEERWLLGGCFLLLLGLRWLTIFHFGFSSPFWDYWQFPWTVYFPFEDGTLSWKSLFAPVNEHRIFFTRVFSLFSFRMNGQWDNAYEAALNSFFFALSCFGLILALWRAAGKRHAALIGGLTVVFCALPFSWENTVWANQSQFYFFAGFSFLAFWLMGLSRPFSARWWLGCAVAFWAMFTVGSGMMAVATVVGLSIYRLLRDPRGWRSVAPTLLAGLAIAALNYPFMVQQHNYGMLTKSVQQFLATFGKTMSWPFVSQIWFWPLLWLPLGGLVISAFISRRKPDRLELWIVALGGWCLLNAVGMGLYRGGFSGGPASRYMDITSLAALCNALALLWLYRNVGQASSLSKQPRWLSYIENKPCTRWFTAGWAALMIYGVMAITLHELSVPAAQRIACQHRAIRNTLQFQQKPELTSLIDKKAEELPYPDPLALISYLRSDRVRAILPTSVRPPLPLKIETQTGFVSPGVYPALQIDLIEPSWGSYGREGDRTVGRLRARIAQTPAYPWLVFPVLNRLGRGFETRLSVTDEVSGKKSLVKGLVEPDILWNPLTVKCPGKANLVIEAEDYDPVAWFSFNAPREKSTVSVWSDRILAYSLWPVWGGLICIAWGVSISRKNQLRRI